MTDEGLHAHPLLGDLAPGARRFLLGCSHPAHFDTGAYLLREGEAANLFHLIDSGRVALEVHVPGKPPIELETLEAGDIVGLSWLFPPHRWQLDARALTPVEALTFDGGCVRAKMDADHDLGYALARRLLELFHRRLSRVRLQRLDIYRAEP